MPRVHVAKEIGVSPANCSLDRIDQPMTLDRCIADLADTLRGC
jgi:hypothetical protein